MSSRRASVRAEYPGANPKVIAETVATPLEEAINGVENMMYMKIGRRLRRRAGHHRHLPPGYRPGSGAGSGAEPRRAGRSASAGGCTPSGDHHPEAVSDADPGGASVPGGKYDSLYMRNYATLKVKDELARLPGVGQIQILAPVNMRCASGWIPIKVAARGLTASDVVTAMQEQNVRVSAGQLGAEPLPQESDFLISINACTVCIPKKSLAISF